MRGGGHLLVATPDWGRPIRSRGNFQLQPSPAACNACLPATGHPAPNVRSPSADMTPAVWRALVTPGGGETVGD